MEGVPDESPKIPLHEAVKVKPIILNLILSSFSKFAHLNYLSFKNPLNHNLYLSQLSIRLTKLHQTIQCLLETIKIDINILLQTVYH